MSAITVSIYAYRQSVRNAALARYRGHRARNVSELHARNMAVAQTRRYDFPGLSARLIAKELDTALETEQVRGLLEGWK